MGSTTQWISARYTWIGTGDCLCQRSWESGCLPNAAGKPWEWNRACRRILPAACFRTMRVQYGLGWTGPAWLAGWATSFGNRGLVPRGWRGTTSRQSIGIGRESFGWELKPGCRGSSRPARLRARGLRMKGWAAKRSVPSFRVPTEASGWEAHLGAFRTSILAAAEFFNIGWVLAKETTGLRG